MGGSRAPSERRSVQAPEVKAWHIRLLGPLHLTGAFWYRLHFFAVGVLPEWALDVVVLSFASFFFVVLRGVRRALISNQAAVLGPAPSWWSAQRRAWRTIYNHAWCMTESYEGWAGKVSESEVEVEGAEHFAALSDREEGFILVTAHVGHWEVGSRLERPGANRHVHVVREPEFNDSAQEFLEGLLNEQKSKLTVHFVRPGDLSLGPRLIGYLRRGHLVALQGDRSSAEGRTTEVSMFNRTIAFPVGPAALGRASGAPLLPVFALREGRGRSRLIIDSPIEVERSSDRSVDLESATQSIADAVERAIERAPLQWFCFRELWPAER